jgi:putative cell wall-binding protein
VATSLVVRSSVDTPDVTRLAGDDRYGTAADVARRGWPQGTSHAFVASGSSFTDGLAGGPLAADRRSPLLLSASDRLPTPTRAALLSLGTKQVTILGGPAAVEDAVADELVAMGIEVDRAAGDDRFATAVAVARLLRERSGTAMLASGRGFADALAAVVPAHAARAPLLLSDRDLLPDPTRAAIGELGIKHVVIAGGTAAISEAVAQTLVDLGVTVERASGPTRYETAVALVEWAERVAGMQPTAVAIAAGADFPDALAGGAYAAMVGAPVLLSGRDGLESTGPPMRWLEGRELDEAYVLGGRVALSTWIRHELQGAIVPG